MEVSSTTANTATSADASQKALESQQEIASKLLESKQEQTKSQDRIEDTRIAQKTGMGNALDLMS